MVLYKLGEALSVNVDNGIAEAKDIILDADWHINERMKSFASELKVIAPQASDFLYFTAVMMHAAEAALINDDGTAKKHSNGSLVTAQWEKVGNESIRWVCSDPSILPYKNNNSDIFPESELKLAYTKWVGRPLCLDHKSSSVDMIRGVIVDTFWDDSRKRIIALCALDKKNHPDLAFKVSSGYATNVSMGTAVGRAVCTEHGCHKVARVESDFCDHMRRKSCYGEINLDLSPIELSLVVTGADPKAKVKQIIAKDLSSVNKAAGILADYASGKIALASAETALEVETLQNEIKKLNEKVEKLLKSDDSNDVNYGTTGSSPVMAKTIFETDQAYSAPEQNISYASYDISKIVLETKATLETINNNLKTLSNYTDNTVSNINEGSNKMTEKKAYHQGTEEPVAPGQKQYPVDPTEGTARMADKHMVGESPFPGVGPVDGLYPEDEALKKKLQRAAYEKRQAIRREALEMAKSNLGLKSEGYYQGTEEPSAPGKPQYTPDPLQEKAKKEDKQMVGAKPFPEVGSVDGLYPGDLEKKKLLARAALSAKFRRLTKPDGSIDKAASGWDIYAGDTRILQASVHDITGGKSDVLYEAVATKPFGYSLINKIKSEGFEKAKASFFKGAQDVLGIEIPGAPAPSPEETPALEAAPELGDSVGDDMKDGIRDKIDDTIDELKQLVSELSEGEAHTELESVELADVAPAPEDETFKAASTNSMRRTVNDLLTQGFKEVIATVKAHLVELEAAKSVLPKKFASMDDKNKLYFSSLVDTAIREAKKTAADSTDLMESFIVYASSTDSLVSQAQAQVTPPAETVVTPGSPVGGAGIKNPFEGFEAPNVDPFTEAAKSLEEQKAKADQSFVQDFLDNNHAKKSKKDDDKVDENKAKVEVPDDTKVKDVAELGGHVVASQADLTTKEGRAMHRAKLAQQGMKISDMLGKAHPAGGVTPKGFDTKPSGDLAKVETLTEVNKAMNDLANLPPKVRKQAQEIAQLVQTGKLAHSEVDELVAMGVDSDAVKYYKAYWAEAKDSDSKDFASQLTAEHAKAKTAADLEVMTVRTKRAYDLAYEMCSKGMIDRSQIATQVDEIMSWNDEGFTSVKNIVAKQESGLSKNASIPHVGLLDSGEIMLPGVTKSAANLDLFAALEAHFANKRL